MKTLSFVTARGFKAGHEDSGQFRSLLCEFVKLLGRQVFCFGRKAEPELSFISFLKRNLELRAKFGFGSRDLRGPIIGRRTRPASGQLVRDCFRARATGQCIRSLKAPKREAPSAADHIDHSPFYPFSSQVQTSFQLSMDCNFRTLFPLPFTLTPSTYGMDYTG